MRNDRFEQSLAEAKLYPQLWRIFAGFGVVILVWLGGLLVLLGIYGAYVSDGRGPLPVLTEVVRLQNPVDGHQVIFLLASFIGLFLGVLIATAALHFRGPGSLFGTWPRWWEGFYKVLFVMAPVYGVLLIFAFSGESPRPVLEPKIWFTILPLTIVLLLIQTGSEEVLFRGYLQQQLAARFQARWIWMWGPAVIFAAAHYSPLAGDNWPLVLLAALTFGLIAADLTERTGSLGAAMGFHFGNNFVGLAILAPSEPMSGLALFLGASDMSSTGEASLGLTASILAMLIVWGMTAHVLDRSE